MRTQEVSVLKANDLKCVKGNSELFSGLDFSVQLGEALVVAGSNGSGKTSLLRILCGFNQPATGNITWCDEPIEKHEDYQQQISYIGHQSGVKLDLTVLENLIFAQRLVGTNRKESEIKEIIRTVGLFKQRNVLARKLSAGQKRPRCLISTPAAMSSAIRRWPRPRRSKADSPLATPSESRPSRWPNISPSASIRSPKPPWWEPPSRH